MPTLEYFLVAESVVVDRETNRVSVFNVFENLNTPQFPVIVPTMTAIAGWNAAAGDENLDFQATLRVTGAALENAIEVQTNFTMTRPRHRTFQRIQGVPLHRAGPLLFEILLNGDRQASHSITVEHIQHN